MSTKWVLDPCAVADSLGIRGIHALCAPQPARLQSTLEFMPVVPIKLSRKGSDVGGRVKALAEPDPVDYGQLGPPEQRPTLAQVGRIGLDHQGLHRDIGVF